jgi:hypothetical protein
MKHKENKPEEKKDKKPEDFSYPAGEDIYARSTEEVDLDPEDPDQLKSTNEEDPDENNEKGFRDDVSGTDLDVPGADQDDLMVDPGKEDEENNFYSLGGDEHNDLDEDKGE